MTAPATQIFVTDQVYRLNSLFDPDETGVGHQPYGYDQITPLYRNYKVNAVRVKFTLTDPTADGMQFAFMCVPPGGSANLQGKDVGAIAERPMCHVRAIPDNGVPVEMVQHIPIAAVSGLTAMQFEANTDFAALVTTHPALIPRLLFSVVNTAGVSASLTIRVDLEFDCVFYERIVQVQS